MNDSSDQEPPIRNQRPQAASKGKLRRPLVGGDWGNAVFLEGDRMTSIDDPYDLERFVQAQSADYDRALGEIKRGRKTSHWMWYVFPQFAGLGSSAMSRRFAIKSIAEARAFLTHSVLGPRLADCAAAAIAVPEKSAREIFGSPDDLKLKSSATLFTLVAPHDSVFEQLLVRFFGGERDAATERLVAEAGDDPAK
jgi:uncharacterized protein (DUF1810 family)